MVKLRAENERTARHTAYGRRITTLVSMVARVAPALGIVVALAALTGCSFSAPHMRPAASSAVAADPAAATVVFVRPSRLGGAITSVIATTEGRFLGETQAKSYFVAKLPPGEHLLVSWSESTPAMRATLAAGRIYYVEVAPKMGWGSARVQLLAITPRRETWSQLPEWMRECEPLQADEPAGQALLQERRDDFADRVKAARESYQGYSAEDREARTLRPEDGVQQPIGTPGAQAAAIPAAPAAAAPPAATPAPAAASSAPKSNAVDTVILKSGAKLRGVVMEDEPTRVAVKLLDGSTKILRRSEVDRVEYGK
jgi:hypothetical protein